MVCCPLQIRLRVRVEFTVLALNDDHSASLEVDFIARYPLDEEGSPPAPSRSRWHILPHRLTVVVEDGVEHPSFPDHEQVAPSAAIAVAEFAASDDATIQALIHGATSTSV